MSVDKKDVVHGLIKTWVDRMSLEDFVQYFVENQQRELMELDDESFQSILDEHYQQVLADDVD